MKAQLYIALDAGFIETSTFEALCAEAQSVSNLIGGLMRYLSTTTHP